MTNTNTTDPLAGISAMQMAVTMNKLAEAGLAVHANGAPYETGTEISASTTLAVKLGVGSAFNEPSVGKLYLIALEVPSPDTDAAEAVAAAAVSTNCGNLFSRIERGWSETTPNGRHRRYLAIEARDDQEFQTLIRSIPSRKSTMNGVVVAELMFGLTSTVAPTITAEGQFAGIVGAAGVPSIVTAAELYGIGVVLDEASDSRDKHARLAYDIREHDKGTSNIRDAFNRMQDYGQVQRLLAEAGWQPDGDDRVAAQYRNGAKTGELLKGNLVFVDRGEDGQSLAGTAVAYRAFDLLVGRTQGKRVLAIAEDVSQWLVDGGIVSARVEVFAAKGERPVISVNQDSIIVMQEAIAAIRAARSRFDKNAPLAFAKTVAGSFDCVISINPAGTPIRWTSKKARNLFIASAQFARTKTDDDGGVKIVEHHHTAPEAVIDISMESLEAPGALPPLEYLATEPIITADGQVVSRHGYDMAARAYISIPHRERHLWDTRYNVPATPTLEDAQKAYEYLDLELFTDFPYVREADRARHLLYILTCTNRELSTGSIAFLFEAADRASGKSLSALIGRIIGQGRPQAQNFYFGLAVDRETQNGLVSLMMANGRHLHCDEIPAGATMKSLVITEAITGVDGDADLRILGGQDTVKRAGAIITACGVNPEKGSDLVRRFLSIAMAVTSGATIGRTGYRHKNIVAFANRNRPELLAAAHTIMLYSLQNTPAHEVSNLDFNHDWGQVFLGAASHLKHESGRTVAEVAMDGWKEEIEAGDETGDAWGELLHHIWVTAAGKPKTAKELILCYRSVSHGEERVPLPPALLGVETADGNSATRWGKEVKKINGTAIPYNGATYRIATVAKAASSNSVNKYVIKCWGADNELVLPGRDPQVASLLASTTVASLTEAADFS